MKKIQVRVPWPQGLLLRPAAAIAQVASGFKAHVRVRIGRRVTDATSILGLAVLCATLNAAVTIEADGDDERDAARAVAACFDQDLPDRPV